MVAVCIGIPGESLMKKLSSSCSLMCQALHRHMCAKMCVSTLQKDRKPLFSLRVMLPLTHAAISCSTNLFTFSRVTQPQHYWHCGWDNSVLWGLSCVFRMFSRIHDLHLLYVGASSPPSALSCQSTFSPNIANYLLWTNFSKVQFWQMCFSDLLWRSILNFLLGFLQGRGGRKKGREVGGRERENTGYQEDNS